jgi:hypothetical protein
MKAKQDIKRYIRNQEPHANMEAANEAVEKFQKGIEALRDECRIPEVLVCYELNVEDDGDTGACMGLMTFGSSLQAPTLAAYAYGKLSASLETAMRKLLKDPK